MNVKPLSPSVLLERQAARNEAIADLLAETINKGLESYGGNMFPGSAVAFKIPFKAEPDRNEVEYVCDWVVECFEKIGWVNVQIEREQTECFDQKQDKTKRFKWWFRATIPQAPCSPKPEKTP